MNEKRCVLIAFVLMAFAGAGAFVTNDAEMCVVFQRRVRDGARREISFWADYTAPTKFPEKLRCM